MEKEKIETQLHIENMNCEGCSSKIIAQLESSPYSHFNVDLARKIVTVKVSETSDTGKIIAMLDEIGFSAKKVNCCK